MIRTARLMTFGVVLLSGCAREEKLTAEDIKAYQLTEADIQLFVSKFQVIDRVMAEASKSVDPELMSRDPYAAFASLEFTPEQKKAIKEAGFQSTGEFLRIVGALHAAYGAYTMARAVEEMRAEMEKGMAGMTPDMKAAMEKEIADMEARAKVEYTVSDHNMEMIKKRYDDITRAFISGSGGL